MHASPRTYVTPVNREIDVALYSSTDLRHTDIFPYFFSYCNFFLLYLPHSLFPLHNFSYMFQNSLKSTFLLTRIYTSLNKRATSPSNKKNPLFTIVISRGRFSNNNGIKHTLIGLIERIICVILYTSTIRLHHLNHLDRGILSTEPLSPSLPVDVNTSPSC